MSIPSNGITPEVIRGVMPPYRLSPDLMAATIAALPAPPPDSTTALREARLTRLLQEVAALKPADAAQAHLATQLLTIRGLVDSFTVRAQAPNLEINQMCRLGRTAAELLRTAAALDRTLARHQQMPTPFYGVVIQDEVDIPALETIWATGTPASAAPNPQPPTGAGTQPIAAPTPPTSAAPGATPPPATPPPATPQPATPQPATALDPVHPRPDPEPTPPPATPQPATALDPVHPRPDPEPTPPPTPPAPPHPQAHPAQSPDPATQPDSTTPEWSITKIDEGPGWSREVLRHRSAAAR